MAARLHRSLRHRLAWLACVAMALWIHVAAAWVVGGAGPGQPGAPRAAPEAPRMSLRSITVAPSSAPSADHAAVRAESTRSAASAQRVPSTDALPMPVISDDESPALADMAQPGVPGATGADRYVPRPELTVAPVIDRSPSLLYPDDGPATGLYVARLALYIDETGMVRRVEADGRPLPEVLEKAARDAFMSTQFSPGQIDGETVKSLIRIEVTFESRERAGTV